MQPHEARPVHFTTWWHGGLRVGPLCVPFRPLLCGVRKTAGSWGRNASNSLVQDLKGWRECDQTTPIAVPLWCMIFHWWIGFQHMLEHKPVTSSTHPLQQRLANQQLGQLLKQHHLAENPSRPTESFRRAEDRSTELRTGGQADNLGSTPWGEWW